MKRIFCLIIGLVILTFALTACGGGGDDQGLEFTRTDDGYSVSIGEATQLTNIVIPSEYSGKPVTEIGADAFASDTLERITIPESVKAIDPEAFAEATALEEIIVDEKSEYFESIDGVLYDASGKKLICYPQAKTSNSFIVPSDVDIICESSFISTKYLSYIILGDEIEGIERYSFVDFGEDIKIYYKGSYNAWNSLNCKSIGDAVVYCYSEEEPTVSGDFWHFDGKTPVIWDVTDIPDTDPNPELPGPETDPNPDSPGSGSDPFFPEFGSGVEGPIIPYE